jgi:hypothetical protein
MAAGARARGQPRVLLDGVSILPHRLPTIRSCRQIIVLQNGRVESAGQPRQLQAESKLYRHLQYVEFNQFATGDIEAGRMNAWAPAARLLGVPDTRRRRSS